MGLDILIVIHSTYHHDGYVHYQHPCSLFVLSTLCSQLLVVSWSVKRPVLGALKSFALEGRGGEASVSPSFQWIFQVPVKGGRDYITPQKARTISGI